MSRLRRQPLLVGSAVLFAALSCTPAQPPSSDTGKTRPPDAAMIDGGEDADTGTQLDSGGQQVPDTGGASSMDSGVNPPADTGSETDAGEPSGEDAGAQQVQAGDPCDYPGEAVCDENNRPTLICQGRSFQPPWNPEFCSDCEVDPNGKLVSNCAVPGFVGLDRAGRFRGDAPSIRRLS
ncbi:MAG: hypothetical protein VX405_02200 [Myxococcota bacterium]|nr:hypothetical protein [Myxococcota bacterium]